MAEDMDPMAEIRASFFVECEELLETLQENLQLMEDGEGDGETINVIFRAVHSIKGGAGAFGMEELVEFAHSFETLLDEVRSDRLPFDAGFAKLCFQSADFLSDLVKAVRDESHINKPRARELLRFHSDTLKNPAKTQDEDASIPALEVASVDPATKEDTEAESGPPLCFDIKFRPLPDLFAVGNEPAKLLSQLNELGQLEVVTLFDELPSLSELDAESPHVSWAIKLTSDRPVSEIEELFEFFDDLCEFSITKAEPDAPFPNSMEPVEDTRPSNELPVVATEVESSAPEPSTDAQDTAPEPLVRKQQVAPKTVVRVDLDRIERLVNLVGELVINQAMLSQSLEQSGLSPHSDAVNGLEEFQRLTRDIQDSVMMIRAQPVKSLFQRMARIVRETSSIVDKDVRLITEGEATEVDKTVIERLADPLTHMIRNAVDHGVETVEERKLSGKPEQGQVHLSASHKSGRVVITVRDDGKGIDRARVLAKALDKGIVQPDAVMGDSEIDNLLFAPGFSTASQVSDVSGRGVGMDVVKTAIQELGGKIAISSEFGKGTTFTISLPLTLAILDGMIVDVADETLVVPLNLVVETITIDDLQVDHIQPGNAAVRVRGDFIPIMDLGVSLGYREPLSDMSGRVVLIIAEDDGQKYAVLVDGIRDQRQVVIKGLDDSFYRAQGIAAATILGDGRIALILDPKEIVTKHVPNTTQFANQVRI